MDHGEVNGVIMLDLRKVFDLISHECLLEKQRRPLFIIAMRTQASGFDRTAQVEPNTHQCTGKIGSGNTDTEKHMFPGTYIPRYLCSPIYLTSHARSEMCKHPLFNRFPRDLIEINMWIKGHIFQR